MFVALKAFHVKSIGKPGMLIRASKAGESVNILFRQDEVVLKAQNFIMDEQDYYVKFGTKPTPAVDAPSISAVNAKQKEVKSAPPPPPPAPKNRNRG